MSDVKNERKESTQRQPPVTAEIVSDKNRSTTLCHEDAVAGSPEDVSVVGEEDAGIGIEFLLRESEEREKAENGEKQ